MERCLPRVKNIAARSISIVALIALSGATVTAPEEVPSTELHARGHLDHESGRWTFEGRAGQTAEVKSDGLDTVVGRLSPTGDLLTEDSWCGERFQTEPGGDPYNSRLGLAKDRVRGGHGNRNGQGRVRVINGAVASWRQTRGGEDGRMQDRRPPALWPVGPIGSVRRG